MSTKAEASLTAHVPNNPLVFHPTGATPGQQPATSAQNALLLFCDAEWDVCCLGAFRDPKTICNGELSTVVFFIVLLC
jgi:hypothetical protein